MLLVVVPFDGNDRYASVPEQIKTCNGIIHRLRRDASFVKKISAHDDKIDLFADRVFFENIDPRIEKITRALWQLVPGTAEMHIRNMQKLHKFILPQAEFNAETQNTQIKKIEIGELIMETADHSLLPIHHSPLSPRLSVEGAYVRIPVMEKVILITGASSGIGKETAKMFQAKNWKVAATMRLPEEAEDLKKIVDLECIRLDVTDPDSIRSAIDRTLEVFGRIDAVVNNAGYALVGPFEAATPEQIERQYETNVLGLMNVCREILPYFRERKKGMIVNIASVGGRMTFPFYSLYNSTKWAVEGFSESLQYEVEQFNIRIKIIEPGPINTDFYARSEDETSKDGLTAYDYMLEKARANMKQAVEQAPDGSVVAQTIYDAVTDDSTKLRYTVNTKGILAARKLLPDRIFFSLIRKVILR